MPWKNVEPQPTKARAERGIVCGRELTFLLSVRDYPTAKVMIHGTRLMIF